MKTNRIVLHVDPLFFKFDEIIAGFVLFVKFVD